MSYHAAHAPTCHPGKGVVELVIDGRARDVGGLTVRRVLPARDRRRVGPFVFFDEMGPAVFPPGEGIQVRPHPHIGLATITYLFAGEIVHRDSLGFVQTIRPGAVNLMTAGSGIVHSERSGDDLDRASRLHGIQAWLALPDALEESAPAFTHYPAADLPEVDVDGATVRVIAGTAFGATSPVVTAAPTRYLDLRLPAGTSLSLPDDGEAFAVYLVAGRVEAGDRSIAPGSMAIACAGRSLSVSAQYDSHVMVIGGVDPGERHIWWNFVSSSRARIERAKSDWAGGRFDPVPGDPEFIPLPD